MIPTGKMLLQNLPIIIQLLQKLQQRLEQNAMDKKLEEDAELIVKAFREKDEKLLRDIFNSI